MSATEAAHGVGDGPAKGAGDGAARAAAKRYLEVVNDADEAGLRALFRPDAVVLNPFGVHEGIEAIVSIYQQVVFPHRTVAIPTAFYDCGDICVMELTGRSPDGEGAQLAVDVFTVDGEGRVSRLAIYFGATVR